MYAKLTRKTVISSKSPQGTTISLSFPSGCTTVGMVADLIKYCLMDELAMQALEDNLRRIKEERANKANTPKPQAPGDIESFGEY